MKIVKTIAIAFLAIGIAACGGKKDGASESGGNSLEGTWEVVKAEGALADMNKGTNYIFEGNKITLSAGIIKTPGTYTLKGDTILIKFDGGTIDMPYTYTFVGEQMVVKVAGTDQVFYMDKK